MARVATPPTGRPTSEETWWRRMPRVVLAAPLVCAAVAGIALWIAYAGLPDVVAVHYSSARGADRWEAKPDAVRDALLFFLLPLACAIAAVLPLRRVDRTAKGPMSWSFGFAIAAVAFSVVGLALALTMAVNGLG